MSFLKRWKEKRSRLRIERLQKNRLNLARLKRENEDRKVFDDVRNELKIEKKKSFDNSFAGKTINFLKKQSSNMKSSQPSSRIGVFKENSQPIFSKKKAKKDDFLKW